MFYEHGVGAVFLAMEPSRYEHCDGNERSDDLRQVLEQGPGLLTRQTMLRTPFVWIQVRPRPPPSAYYRHPRRSLIDRITRVRRRSPPYVAPAAELFRPRFSAECYRWLNESRPDVYQRLQTANE